MSTPRFTLPEDTQPTLPAQSAFGRVALVHDYWVHLRGGERIFLALMRLFPQADCYVLIRRRWEPEGEASLELHTSALRFVPFGGRYFRALLPLYPLAARHLDLRGYDLVISSSSGFCHGVRTTAMHICYCHSPLRYIWNERDATLARARTPLTRLLLSGLLDTLREADYAAAQRVTTYVANSTAVQARIAEYYHRTSVVVHPFIDLRRFKPVEIADIQDYFLVVSQLLPYKRVDLAIQSCNRLGRRLIVVGSGPQRADLERQAGPNITFLSRVSEEELAGLYAHCAALLQCGEEDFGMASLEAQAAGRPVLAYGTGGALETVVEGQTGLFFAGQSAEALSEAIQAFDARSFDPAVTRAHAARFDEAHFRSAMLHTWQHSIAEGSAREGR
jgi:glycosyltransferase involved in cell wall biosynthesis